MGSAGRLQGAQGTGRDSPLHLADEEAKRGLLGFGGMPELAQLIPGGASEEMRKWFQPFQALLYFPGQPLPGAPPLVQWVVFSWY